MKINRSRLRRDERTFEVAIERRSEGDERPLRIVGHPIVYDRWSQDLGGFRERVRPGAVTKALLEDDIRALLNHDPNFVLGRNRAATLSLSDQAGSLRMELYPPDTGTVRDLVVTPMERGDINQMSFAFRTVRDEWREPKTADGLYERDLLELRLFDVSIVTFPAYTQTDASLRSIFADVGIQWEAVAALAVRVDRGVPTTESDRSLVESAIAALRSLAPEEEQETTESGPAPSGRDVARLRRLLDVRERELALA